MSTRYFRTAYLDSYYAVDGDQVMYFAPHVPNGAESQWPASNILRCASLRPDTDGEVTHKQMTEIRARLDEAVAEHEKRVSHDKWLRELNWRDLATA
jgi:hypothetical protein